MSDPQNKDDIVEQLATIQEGLTNDLKCMSDAQFTQGTGESWSAEGYLKHVLLSTKLVVKGMELPAEDLQARFDLSGRASRSYGEILDVYKNRLDEGIRAEQFDRIVPVAYRFPEGVTNERAHLVESWNNTNQRLIKATQRWSEADLDSLQMPHAAIGTITLREMLFFTIFHNTLHWHDIRHAGGL